VITLVSATYTLDYLQEDGRRWVVERFTPSEGEPVESRYLAEAGEDFDAHLAAMGEGLLMKWNRPLDPEPE
jgi:hypothetical protein